MCVRPVPSAGEAGAQRRQHVPVTASSGRQLDALHYSCRPRLPLLPRAVRRPVQVDGGMDAGTVAVAAQAGANVFVAGTFLFDHPKVKQANAGMPCRVLWRMDDAGGWRAWFGYCSCRVQTAALLGPARPSTSSPPALHRAPCRVWRRASKSSTQQQQQQQ